MTPESLDVPAPRRILMTLDAVGGVWRYGLDLAAALGARGVGVVLAGLGPPPLPAQRRDAEAVGRLVWLEAPLDWMAEGPAALEALPGELAALVRREGVDLVHLNAPSQAVGLDLGCPVVAVSHSCLVTWWQAVRGAELPAEWEWQRARTRAGFRAADAVVAPSRSHAAALGRAYGPLDRLNVVANATSAAGARAEKAEVIFAAGRWWDEGKNAAVLDAAAARTHWQVVMAGACDGPQGQRVRLHHAEAPGVLPAAEMARRLGRAAIVASPSRYEPFGLVALEAAAAGAALVLADMPTYRELWEGVADFADPDDPAAFAAALDGLAADPARRAALGEAARARARGFSPAAQAEAMLGVYAAAAARFAQRPASSAA